MQAALSLHSCFDAPTESHSGVIRAEDCLDMLHCRSLTPDPTILLDGAVETWLSTFQLQQTSPAGLLSLFDHLDGAPHNQVCPGHAVCLSVLA